MTSETRPRWLVLLCTGAMLLTACNIKCSSGPAASAASTETQFRMTPDRAVAWRLPPIAFSFDIPKASGLDVIENPGFKTYVTLTTMDDKETVVETVSLGKSTLTRAADIDTTARDFMRQFEAAFQQQGLKFLDSAFTDTPRVPYAIAPGYRATIQSAGDTTSFVGTYAMQAVFLHPPDGGDGLLVLVVSRPGAEVKDWDGFRSPGLAADILRTFKFD